MSISPILPSLKTKIISVSSNCVDESPLLRERETMSEISQNFQETKNEIGTIKKLSQIPYLVPISHLHCAICCNFKPEFIGHTGQPTVRQRDDLFWCLRHFLRFGKLFGIIPFDGVFGGDLSSLTFRWKSPGTIYSLIVMVLLLVNVAIGLLGLLHFGGKNATEWTWSAESFIFYCMGISTHTFFILRGKKLICIFRNWTELNLEFAREDSNLYRDVNFIAAAIYTSAILENALLQLIFFYITDDDPSTASKHSLERYYDKAQTHWSAFIPYCEAWAILIFLTNKFALYAWNFVDILIILTSRAIYYKFKMLNELSRERLIKSEGASFSSNTENWKKVVQDHETLCNFLKKFEDLLSPLIFASYAINCFYICLQLHLGLSPGKKSDIILQQIYTVWSFIHLVVRVFLVSLSAAKINDYAHKTLEILYLCPESCESREVERMRCKISSKKIGLSGLGCFIITRPFILKVISVIFTFEIVLLQAPGPFSCQSNHSSTRA